MTRVLITAGAVYSALDSNKLISNRVRGIWASRFAHRLAMSDHEVTLLVADTQHDEIMSRLKQVERNLGGRYPIELPNLNVVKHNGFYDYQTICHNLAKTHDAAIMAAAVVNWIPKTPFEGKMPTAGFKANDEINIPFILAPHVIDGMRKANPKLTLIGCKMTIGADRSDMLTAAYKTLTNAKCHAVIANDMGRGLKTKTVLYPDQVNFDFQVDDRDDSFYRHLEAILFDEHFTTGWLGPLAARSIKRSDAPLAYDELEDLFDDIVDKYRERFVKKTGDSSLVFGSLAVRGGFGALCSPREKGQDFSKRNAVDVIMPTEQSLRERCVEVVDHSKDKEYERLYPKATMNAVLLLRHLQQYPKAGAVLHLHEQLPNTPTVKYAPPGTVRDNLREIPAMAYNIEGHGCIVALNEKGGWFV